MLEMEIMTIRAEIIPFIEQIESMTEWISNTWMKNKNRQVTESFTGMTKNNGLHRLNYALMRESNAHENENNDHNYI